MPQRMMFAPMRYGSAVALENVHRPPGVLETNVDRQAVASSRAPELVGCAEAATSSELAVLSGIEHAQIPIGIGPAGVVDADVAGPSARRSSGP